MSSSSSTNFRSFPEQIEDNDRGIPDFCMCGERLVMRTSGSVRNPGRLFYCCPVDTPGRLHTWKWTDTCLVEEVEDLKRKIVECENIIEAMRGELKRMKLVVTVGVVLAAVYWLFSDD